MKLRMVASKVKAAATRREMLGDVEHLVVPVVVMVEGVRSPMGSQGPELVLASELARSVGGWNGRPIVVAQHPTENGEPVSVASSPELWQDIVVGKTFGAAIDGDRLTCEAWIDLTLAAAVPGAQAIVDAMEAGDVVEVSGGYFAAFEETTGTYAGTEYVGVQRNFVPDHLAIGVGIGACSVEDGCGAPRANCKSGAVCACGGVCKVKQKAAITNDPDPQTLESIIARAMRRLTAATIEPTPEAIRAAAELTHDDLRQRLHAALQEIEGGWRWISYVWNDRFIYSDDGDGRQWQRTYTVDGVDVTIGAERVEVVVTIEATPVGSSPTPASEGDMKPNEKRVEALIASTTNKWAETDRAFLLGCTDEQLAKLEATAVETPDKTESETPVEAPAPVVAASAKPLTPAEWLAAAPPDMRAAMERATKAEADRKAGLIAAIKANARNPYSDAELAAMSAGDLERLSALAAVEPVADFSGRTVPRANNDEVATREPNALAERIRAARAKSAA